MPLTEAPVEISDEIKEGVLSIPHGFGHNRKGTKIKLAEKNPGESINDLTDDFKIAGEKWIDVVQEIIKPTNYIRPM